MDGSKIGLFGEKHRVVDTPNCIVSHPSALEIAGQLRKRPPERDYALVALDVRVTSDGQCAPALVIQGRDRLEAHAYGEELAKWLSSNSQSDISGVSVAYRSPKAATTLGGIPTPVLGDPTVVDRLGETPLYFPPGSFSQAHASQTGQLQRLVKSALAELGDLGAKTLVDLYSGVGTFGLYLAESFGRVILVESNAAAAEAAQRAASSLGLESRIQVRGAASETTLTALKNELGAEGLVVVVDPPRSGLSAEAINGIASLAPEAIVMVSCDPTTMARDLALLGGLGFRVGPVQPVDMQPGTDQVECVATLMRQDPEPPAIVAEGNGWMLVEKPPLIPTTPHPEWPTSMVDDVRRLLPNANPCHRLDVGTSGLLLMAVSGAEPPDLGEAAKSYTALVRGITRKAGTLRMPLPDRGRNLPAETSFRRLEVCGGHSLLEVQISTGRTHQIRRHLAAIGHPVLGDKRYGHAPSNRHLEAKHGLNRPFLHAGRLETDVGTFESSLWPDLQVVLDSVRCAPQPKRGRRKSSGKKA
ncbi:MAG: RsmD family RNA methyltransferase [Myxococcales bacterium]|nr:RsmD family RNA methyltransferase [Myxococcales bacterium]